MDRIEELVIRAQNGDNDAMNKVISKNSYLVKNITRKYYLIDGEIEDLVQWGMLGLFNAVMTYKVDSRASFKTYASMLIRNVILDAIKKAYTGSGKVFKEIDFVDVSEFSGDGDLEKEVIDRQEFSELFEFLMKNLSGLERDVIKYFLKGYSYKEIANELNKTPKSIDSALSKAKTKIKKKYLQSKEGK